MKLIIKKNLEFWKSAYDKIIEQRNIKYTDCRDDEKFNVPVLEAYTKEINHFYKENSYWASAEEHIKFKDKKHMAIVKIPIYNPKSGCPFSWMGVAMVDSKNKKETIPTAGYIFNTKNLLIGVQNIAYSCDDAFSLAIMEKLGMISSSTEGGKLEISVKRRIKPENAEKEIDKMLNNPIFENPPEERLQELVDILISAVK